MMKRTGSAISGIYESMVRDRQGLVASAAKPHAPHKARSASMEPLDNVTLTAMNEEVSDILGLPRKPVGGEQDGASGPERLSKRASTRKGAPARETPASPPKPTEKELHAAMESLHKYVSDRIAEVGECRRPLTPQEVQGYLDLLGQAAGNLSSVRPLAEEYLKEGAAHAYDRMADIFNDMAAAAKALESIQDSHFARSRQSAAYQSQIAQQCTAIAMDVSARRTLLMSDLARQHDVAMNPGAIMPASFAPGPYGAAPGALPGLAPGAMGVAVGTAVAYNSPYPGAPQGYGQPGYPPPAAPGGYGDRGYRTA